MKINNEITKQAVRDYYGSGAKDIGTVMKYLIKRNKPKLTEQQKEDVWYIQTNLRDIIYRQAILSDIT